MQAVIKTRSDYGSVAKQLPYMVLDSGIHEMN